MRETREWCDVQTPQTHAHSHGRLVCYREPDHVGDHEGVCWTCYDLTEDDQYAIVTWYDDGGAR